ncbi:MAG: hypothetical protein BGO25_03320 [Acidobacteriales bacterium 59-55]|nr:hypothetical protein [Terriglobales bacterium]OJV40190.1 MAG: hypothetical protein BGO25_03320 [Acidobacteriales bacterium 59-55]
MTPSLRKLNLTAHVTFSVSWIGAAFAFFILSIAGLVSRDATMMRGAYLSMNLICLYCIIPLSLAALGTGLIQSLCTQWGLFRHYWVLVKFILTVLAVAVLLMHQFSAMARAVRLVSTATAGAMPTAELGSVGFVLARASGIGILVLSVITILSVYKPWGLTPYGEDKRRELRYKVAAAGIAGSLPGFDDQIPNQERPRKLQIVTALVIGFLALAALISMHLMGHGFHHGH